MAENILETDHVKIVIDNKPSTQEIATQQDEQSENKMLKQRYIETLTKIDIQKDNDNDDDVDSTTFAPDGIGSEPSDSETENDLYDELENIIILQHISK